MARRYEEEIAHALDRRLRVLTRGSSLVQRAIGKGLVLLAQVDGYQAMGYSTLDAYAAQRLGITGRHARALAAIERRLPGFPRIDRGYQEGRLNFSQVQLLLRFIQPIDDADWAKLAEGLTITELKCGLEAWKKTLDAHRALPCAEGQEPPAGYPLPLPEEEDECEPARWVQFTASPLLAAKYDVALEILRRTLGADLPAGRCVEYFIGEFMSGEGGPALAASQIPFSCCHVEEERQERRYKRWWRRQVIEREMRDFECDCARMSELWTHLDWRVAHVHLESLDKACEHRTPDAIDAHLQEILKVERRFERHLLRMLERFKRNAFYMTLEYPSFQNYCQNRLGISPSLGLSLVALSGHLRRLPNLDAALQAGRVNRSQAELVSRVATPGTVDRWIAHASATTVRFLREDVRAAERMRAADPENFRRTGGFADLQTSSANVDHAHVSPSVAQTADLQTFSTDVEHAHVSPQTAGLLTFSAETIRRIGDVETPPPSIPDLLTLREQIQRMLRGRNDEEFLGKNSVPVRFKLPPDAVALWDDAWRAVSHLVGCHAGYDDVLDTIVDAFLSEHLREALESIRRHPLLDRRDWRCANPTCSRRSNLHGHHVKFRSRGGGDEDANIAYLCRACHLRGVHEGWITVSGEAPDGLTWILGARLEGGPHLVVSGRVVMQTPARHALSA